MRFPEVAVLVWLVGWLAIAAEFKSPRLIFPAVCGIAAITGAAFYLLNRAAEPAGLLWLSIAAVLFAIEVAWHMRFLAALAGSAVLLYLFCFLIAPAEGIGRGWAIVAAIVPGTLLAHAAAGAREGRRAKRLDL